MKCKNTRSSGKTLGVTPLDKTFTQPDVFAVVNCSVVALSVFYSTVLMRSLLILKLWTALT